MSDFIPEEEFTPTTEWQEFSDRVQERLDERGTIEGEDPFDMVVTALADIHIALQQVYIIMRAIRKELEGTE